MARVRTFALLISASLFSAAPSFAPAHAEEAPSVNPKDKMVCKRTQKTGTRFYSQTCKTVAQWDALAEQQRRDLRETVDRPQIEIRRN